MTPGTTTYLGPPPIGRATIAATLSLNLLALALPIVMLQIFDRVVPYESYDTLSLLFLGLCVVAVLEFFLRWARIVILGATGADFEQELSREFVARTLHADPQAFHDTTIAAHMDRFGAIGHLRSYYSGQGRILAIDLPFTVGFVLMIGLIGGWLIAVPLLSLVALLIFRMILRRAQKRIFDERKTLDNRRHSFLFEVLSQVSTIKCNLMEPQLLRRYELLQDQTARISHALIHFSGFSQTFGALFSQVAVAAMGLLGAFLIIRGDIGIAELAACMLLNGRTVQPLLKALNLWSQSESLAASQGKLEQALETPQRQRTANLARALHGRIRFEGVSLKDGRDGTDVLSDFSRTIDPGTFVGVSGVAGDGNARILRLILAEVPPLSGEVRIDNRPAHAFSNTHGAGGLVYVDHQPVRFSGTLLENMSAFGDGDAVRRALAFASALDLDDIIHRLPLGHNTALQESAELANNPTVLQRISLVRALALQPKILLLNNVTTAMDMPARIALARALQGLRGAATIVYAGADAVLLDVADDLINFAPATDDLWDDFLLDDGSSVTGASQARPKVA